MELKDRILQLRTEKKWKQSDLAEKLGIHQKQVSAYERGANLPSTETLIKLSEIFDVSLDYLVFESKSDTTKVDIKDRELLRQFEEVDRMDDDKKEMVKKFISMLINEDKIKKMVS